MRSTLAMMAVLLGASMAWGQATAGQTPAQAQGAQAGTASAGPAGQRLPQAKSTAEFEAYNLANSKTDPAQAEAAADDFATKFPNSELKELLYVRVMGLYQQQNNSAKVIVTGRKAIELNPTNPITLVAVATAIVFDTQETDLDRDARYAEASKDAQSGLDNMDMGLRVAPEQVAMAKANLRSYAYDTLGVIAMNKKDYATAQQNFQKAADVMADHPDAVVYLRLSVVQDRQEKYAEALASANKAVQYAQDGSAEKNLAQQQQTRLQKLITEKSPPPAAPATPPATTPH